LRRLLRFSCQDNDTGAADVKHPTLFVTLAALWMSSCALARADLAMVSIIDRQSGTVLPSYYHRGEYWVAGRPGARYAIQIRNCSGGRVLAVTSVDGVNVLSGASAGWGQSGYVFDPGQAYEITGWRKSNEEVAAFTFTDASDSYAGRTGRPVNIGVIGVALFRERERQAYYVAPRILSESVVRAPAPDTDSAQAQRAQAGSPSAAAPMTAAPWSATRQAQAKLGTGHGEREYSFASDTEFHRQQPEPNQVIRIRYDSYENLIAMGVIRRWRPTGAAPNPFPGSRQRDFVPDPP
jgi:hypothetical protein